MCSVENVPQRTKQKSFTIESILKMDKRELIKIPSITHIIDTQKLSRITPVLESSLKKDKEMKCETALDLSINILGVEKERFRKLYKDHAQINNINGLYTNKRLSDGEHLAVGKRKHNSLLEQTESMQTLMEGENIEMKNDRHKTKLHLKETVDTDDTSCHHDDVIDTTVTDSDVETRECRTAEILETPFYADSLINEDVCDITNVGPADNDEVTFVEDDELTVENTSLETTEEITSEHSLEGKKLSGLFNYLI